MARPFTKMAWLLSPLLLLFLATPGLADWQYTKWGMTPEQVIAASGGKAVETTAEEQKGKHRPAGAKTDVPLKAPFESGRFRFLAFFYFSAPGGRLVGVHLELINSDLGAELLESLRQKYGKPDIDLERDVSRVAWRASGDEVTYLAIPPTNFSINYDPLITKDNEEL